MKYQINQRVRHAKSGDGTIIYIDRPYDAAFRAYAVRFEKSDNSRSGRVANGAGPYPHDDWDEEYCAWMRESELTPIDDPIMVYVSDVSEKDALLNICSRILLADLGNKYKDRYICSNPNSDKHWTSWKFAVPITSIKKPTIKRSEVEAAKSLIAKIESGDFELED